MNRFKAKQLRVKKRKILKLWEKLYYMGCDTNNYNIFDSTAIQEIYVNTSGEPVIVSKGVIHSTTITGTIKLKESSK